MSEEGKTTEPGAAYTGKYKRIRRSDYKVAPALRWVIKDVLPVGATLTMVGDPKCGKTLIAMSMALAAITGKLWCGLPVRKCRALYVSPEDFTGLIRRQMAWEAMHNGGEPVDLDFFNVAINLTKLDSLKEAFEAIRAQDMQPEFIVLDTLARATMGASENDEDAMTEAFYNLEAFKESIGNPLVLILHHNNRGHNYRGSTAIDATPDGMLGVKKDGECAVLSSISMRMSGGFNSMKLSFEQRPVMTEDGWQLERTLSGKLSFVDEIEKEAGTPIGTNDGAYRTILSECERLGFPSHTALEKACVAAGVTKTRFDAELKYMVDVGRLDREKDPDDGRLRRYKVNKGGYDVYGRGGAEGEGKGLQKEEQKISISMVGIPPKGGIPTNTEYSIPIPNTEIPILNTESDKTGTLTPAPTSSSINDDIPLQTGTDHNDAFTALKELTDGPSGPASGPATQPDRETRSKQVGPASAT
jgi:hypothetical protein